MECLSLISVQVLFSNLSQNLNNIWRKEKLRVNKRIFPVKPEINKEQAIILENI